VEFVFGVHLNHVTEHIREAMRCLSRLRELAIAGLSRHAVNVRSFYLVFLMTFQMISVDHGLM
jgi:hypothetical protein